MNKNKKGLLLVISGPSGCGKGTICKRFLEKRDDTFLSVSMTTRQPREGEVDGVHYYFASESDFEAKIKNDEMLEYASFCGNYYGTPKKAVYEMLEAGKNVILEIEVQGAMQVRSKYPEGVYIFVAPPSMEELRNRLVGRGTESEQVLEQRLGEAKRELAQATKYNYILLNDTIEDALCRLEMIIGAEQCRIERNIDFIKNL